MANPFKNGGSDSNNNPNIRDITAKNFFGRRNGGYDEKREFLAWGELSRDEDVANVDKFLQFVTAGYKIIKTSTVQHDQGGTPYVYLTVLLPNNDQDGVKLVQNGPWARVYGDYRRRIIRLKLHLMN